MSSTGRAVLRSLITPLTAAVVTLALVTALVAGVFAASGDHLWSRSFGDGDEQGARGSGLHVSTAADNSGNTIIAGEFFGGIDFGGGTLTSAGNEDIFLAKLDPSGNHLWSKHFGSAAPEIGTSVAVDNGGNIYIAGSFVLTVNFGGGTLTATGGWSAFLAKFDPSGNHVWSQRFSGCCDQYTSSVSVDASGSIVLTGWIQGSADFGGGLLTSAGNNDIFIAKFDTDGNHQWSKRFGDSSAQWGAGVSMDGAGNVLLTGSFVGTVDFGGGPIVTNGVDIYVTKFDSDGNHLWSKTFGDGVNPPALSVAVDGAGNVLLTGDSSGNVDFGGGVLAGAGSTDVFLAKLDPSGNHLWSKRFGDSNNQHGMSVAVDDSGNVFLTGAFWGSVNFGGGTLSSVGGVGDVYLAKFDAGGNHLWSKRFGDGSNHQYGRSVAVDPAGRAIIAGDFLGSIDFGGGLLTSAGLSDVFVARFAAPAPSATPTPPPGPPAVGGVVELAVGSDDSPDAQPITRGPERELAALAVALAAVGVAGLSWHRYRWQRLTP